MLSRKAMLESVAVPIRVPVVMGLFPVTVRNNARMNVWPGNHCPCQRKRGEWHSERSTGDRTPDQTIQ